LNLGLEHTTDEDVIVVYEGEFDLGMKNGMGKLYIENGSFSLESKFICDTPLREANTILLKLPKPAQTEEAVIDPKAKKPDQKVAQPRPEETLAEQKNKLIYEIGKENNAIEFEIHIGYQGPPYEDTSTPAIEEKQAAAAPAKGGKGAKPVEEVKQEIRMITPDPVLMANESGRTFEFELGRMEKHKPADNSIGTLSQEALAADGGASAAGDEEKWCSYKFNQLIDTLKQKINTVEGICKVSDLHYKLDDFFKSGTYEIIIRDVTIGIATDKKMPEQKIELTIIDPEELAAQQAALAA
jgi:hypothetical protein